jgi:hypothetical protein
MRRHPLLKTLRETTRKANGPSSPAAAPRAHAGFRAGLCCKKIQCDA